MILIFLIDLWKWQLRSLWCYHAMMHNGKLRGNNVTFNHFTFTRLWHELSHCENLSLVGRSLLVHVQWCAKLRFIRNARSYDKISDDFTTLVFILLRFSVNSQAWITQPFLMHVKNAKWSCQIFCQLFSKNLLYQWDFLEGNFSTQCWREDIFFRVIMKSWEEASALENECGMTENRHEMASWNMNLISHLLCFFQLPVCENTSSQK